LLLLKIEMFNWYQVFLDRAFLPGIICALILSGALSFWINQAKLSPWLSLVLAALSAFVSLCIIALFNNDLRSNIKAKMSKK